MIIPLYPPKCELVILFEMKQGEFLMSSSVDRVRILWADHLGLARGKFVPASLAASGARHCTGLWALGYDRDMTPYTPGYFWEEGLPDFEATFDESDLRPGWEPNTQVVVANLRRHGTAFEVSPKAALDRAVAAWQELGYEPFVGIELEAYLLEPDGRGGWKPLDAPGAYVYGTGPSVDPTGTIDEIWRVATECGMPIESVNSEYDPAQFEFTLRYTNAVRSADDAFLFKLMAKEVAAKRGYLLTFMGKPLSNNGGSGLHFNMSFKDAEINVFYNAADVGISTADGEGWGLCQFEQMGVGVPQVVPDIGGFKEFCTAENSVLVKPTVRYYLPTTFSPVGGEAMACDPHAVCLGMEEYVLNSELREKHGLAAKKKVTYRIIVMAMANGYLTMTSTPTHLWKYRLSQRMKHLI
jgi:hypothetical protein